MGKKNKQHKATGGGSSVENSPAATGKKTPNRSASSSPAATERKQSPTKAQSDHVDMKVASGAWVCVSDSRVPTVVCDITCTELVIDLTDGRVGHGR